jgi:predicted nucleotidyltransferase
MDEDCIRLLVKELDKYPIIFAYLFGSHAKDKSTKLSDLDLAVFFDRKIQEGQKWF